MKEGDTRWFKEKEKISKMRDVLLKHFGLIRWKSEYPWKKIQFMSPRDLILERRKKEKKLEFPRLVAKSSTAGFHVDADDYYD